VVEAGTNVTLECSSDRSASNITWYYDGATYVVADHCSSSDARFITTSNGNDCYLTALGIQGPYGCSDGSGKTARAVVIVIGNLMLLRVKLQRQR